MQWFYLWVAAFLLVNVLVGMVRIMIGPTRADRMLAAQLLGTTGVAMLLLMAEATGHGALRDVALVFAILASVATVAFVRRTGADEPPEAPLRAEPSGDGGDGQQEDAG